MNKQTILNKEQNRVNLFIDTIKIDSSLPKYKVEDNFKKEDDTIKTSFNKVAFNEVEEINYSELKKWYESQNFDIKDFNITLSNKMRNNIEATNVVSGVTFRNVFVNNNIVSSDDWGGQETKTRNLFETVKNYFREKRKISKEKAQIKNFDVIKFFSDIKSVSQQEFIDYRDRINEYITCIGFAEKAGQTALKEKLFEKLVINKYESILYAKGYRNVLTENMLVKFAQNCPKALSLDYIANYTRTIPIEALNKILEANTMEVFDNYVILHYDPDNNSVRMTNKEKEHEAKKAKDPILFGVISGSNKLYYICDWIDEFYEEDITWDTIVEALGKEIIESNVLTKKIS